MFLRPLSIAAHPLLRVAVLATLLALGGFGLAEAKRGRGGDDHDRAWRGVQSGEILPLQTILASLPPSARVIEVEFEYEHGAPIYEIEYIDADGRLIEVEIDARNGAVLKQEFD